MRKQTKIVLATALFALGASITSMAASKGTWELIDGEWYCLDSDGEVIENEFCLSGGKQFYVGDDGALVRSEWVEDDGDYFYVNSAGEMVTSEWRYLTPYEDEDEEEQWFWFKANGERAEDTKLVINGKTYFFDADGQMLTGWVQSSDGSYEEASTDDIKNTTTYYCDEDGARVSKEWIWAYAPSVDLDDIGSDDEEHWYWIKSSGKPATGKNSSINGETYFFDNEGKMLTGWIATSTDGYVEIWENDDDEDGYFDIALNEYAAAGQTVYFAKEDGHMKKDCWLNEYANVEFGADDSDNDKYWFYIKSNGEVYIPDMVNDEDIFEGQRYDFDDAEENEWDDAINPSNCLGHNDGFSGILKKIDGKTYCFDHNGQMVSDFVVASDNNATVYYFGGWNDGARKDGSQTIADDNGVDHRFYFATDADEVDGYFNAVGVSGAKNGKLYDRGMLVTADEEKYEIKEVKVRYEVNGEIVEEDAQFIVNKSGTIQSSAKEYEEDDDVLIDATNATFYGDADDEDVDALKNSVTSWETAE